MPKPVNSSPTDGGGRTPRTMKRMGVRIPTEALSDQWVASAIKFQKKTEIHFKRGMSDEEEEK